MRLLNPLVLATLLTTVVSLDPHHPCNLLERQAELVAGLAEVNGTSRCSDTRRGDSLNVSTPTGELERPIIRHNESKSPSPRSTSINSPPQHAHQSALPFIDEEVILSTYGPDPLAYWRYDQENEEAHPTLLVFHIALASLSFFALLPITIFLKGGKSPLAILSQLGFLATAILSLVFGIAYKRSTPALYEGSSHTKLGWITMIIVIALNALDVVPFVRTLLSGPGAGRTYFASLLGRKKYSPSNDEIGLLPVAEVAEEEEDSVFASATELGEPLTAARSNTVSQDGDEKDYSHFSHDEEELSPQLDLSTARFGSNKLISIRSKIVKLGGRLVSLAHILVVVLAYIEVLTGIIVYSGSCRAAYLNGCLTHIIKGSIFVIYGLINFCRYIGAFAEYGWAWNRRPAPSEAVSAEFVESLLCFLYGVTQTWMERFGHQGAPYSVKDLQHISIDVMFWFAGLLGMLMESKKVRGWLANPVIFVSGLERSTISPPPSYSASFNPFPAIIIGTTGIAMSAHAQIFQFQVEVHALWGLLLGLFAAFRFLTYFFLWLRPPTSILPSRPPTEAVGALLLTSGGIVFLLSTEQVAFAALRHGFDDIMAFLNVTISLVSIAFAWIVILFALQGWALRRFHAQARHLRELHMAV
ncbi:hypothetical protein BCR35DRAFT_350424 [Leucosporidium creatinivorum]|uniref:Cytoplasmic protein n=1 Tax=Leucosporidium creatinivorum TaxID=106004 RepID=A0A1Y2FZB5_9BASI|nr:hypothetical protein BCR35DRAFT_350424 [Leucosporidium creatinivorum]